MLSASGYGHKKGSSSSTKILIALVVVLVAAAVYYFAVYRKKHPAAVKSGTPTATKEGYHNAWGATTPAHIASLNQKRCLSRSEALAQGCAMECAEFSQGLTQPDCMQKCYANSKGIPAGVSLGGRTCASC